MKLRTLEKEALQLPLEDRAKLAHRLLESLDDLSEKEADALWATEVQRRAKEIDEGKVKLVSMEELQRRVKARLK